MSAQSPKLTEVFFAALPDALRCFRTQDPREILRVPAKASDVGDLIVYNDGDELTVEVGKISHRHFDGFLSRAEREEDRQREAAEDAAKWIEEILADRVRFRVEYSAGRVIAGSSWDPSESDGGRWLKPTDQAREYLWSGEQPAGRPAAG